MERIEINNDFPLYEKKCELLHMFSIPYIGQFSDEYYNFLTPFLILKTDNLEKIPYKIKNRINKLGNIPFEYFHLTLDTSSIFTKNETKLNIVPHPYIFYDFKGTIDQTHNTYVYTCLITDEDNFNLIIKESPNDYQYIKINPDCDFNDQSLKRETIIHPSEDNNIPSISPINLNFIINLNCQLIHFYLIVLGNFNDTIVRGCCCEIMILPSALSGKIFLGMIRNFNEKKSIEDVIKNVLISKEVYEDCFKQYFYIFIDKIRENNDTNEFKNNMIELFEKIFEFKKSESESIENYKRDIQNMGNYYYNYFKCFICFLFHCEHNEKNYKKIIAPSLFDNYIVNIIEKFINFHIKIVSKIYHSYENYVNLSDSTLNNIEKDVQEEYENNIWPELKKFICSLLDFSTDDFDEKVNFYKILIDEKKENKNIELFKNLKNKIRNNNIITRDDLSEINEVLIDKLFFNTWVYKGKPENVHYDFGSVSFLNESIDPKYFCSKNERINLCEEMIQFLEKIDNCPILEKNSE